MTTRTKRTNWKKAHYLLYEKHKKLEEDFNHLRQTMIDDHQKKLMNLQFIFNTLSEYITKLQQRIITGD